MAQKLRQEFIMTSFYRDSKNTICQKHSDGFTVANFYADGSISYVTKFGKGNFFFGIFELKI